jgi:hypothetical protein
MGQNCASSVVLCSAPPRTAAHSCELLRTALLRSASLCPPLLGQLTETRTELSRAEAKALLPGCKSSPTRPSTKPLRVVNFTDIGKHWYRTSHTHTHPHPHHTTPHHTTPHQTPNTYHTPHHTPHTTHHTPHTPHHTTQHTTHHTTPHTTHHAPHTTPHHTTPRHTTPHHTTAHPPHRCFQPTPGGRLSHTPGPLESHTGAV